MAYLVSARKYRPQLFEELVGQEHIAGTIKNAIAKGRVGHAYLFSGPRGIGKTSAARIFAKALNCERGPTPTPCNQCVFCREITEGRALDLVEIDGASNRRVDEVRQLRENVRFVPSSAKYKIYIIDEVHMLTPEAFNALLKTLEEPPEHVVFIFATTEVNKVPQTIRSRCQQFVFKRIPIPRIIEVLIRICADLKAEAEEKALFWIAKSAQGSMRDAESILDQMVSYCGGNIIKEADVFYVLGLPAYDVYHRFAASIAGEDSQACLAHLDRLLADGLEVNALLAGMIEYFRNLYVLAVCENNAQARDSVPEFVSAEALVSAVALIDLPKEEIERMRSLLKDYSQRDVHNILTVLSKTYQDTKNSELARELFEIALMKMVRYREIIHPAALIRRLEELKREIDRGDTAKGGAAAGGQTTPDRTAADRATDDRSAVGRPAAGDTIDGGRTVGRPHAGNSAARAKDASPDMGTVSSGGRTAPSGAQPGPAGVDLAGRVVGHISKSRRALAEFLSKAKSCSLENNLLTFVYDEKEKLGYQHVSEESAKRYIETVARELVQPDLRVRFIVERSKNENEEQFNVSPGVSKVIDIFKGEIVPKNNLGGN